MPEFYTLVTAAGLAYEAERITAREPINLAQISAGDGGGASYDPTEAATALRNEVWRAALTDLSPDATNPSRFLVEGLMPADIGGFTVREVGIWTDTGVLYGICKYPASEKPLPGDGVAKELFIRAVFETSNAASVTLTVDNSIVNATRDWVLGEVAAHAAAPNPHPQYATAAALSAHQADRHAHWRPALRFFFSGG
ncbi:phage tail protein [Pseudomonas kunmingensis]|uniref:phage tail protein n=1 Tax=Stutzerimonas kunmingensis TaxID=1211807 RepID=UPI0017462346|nr:phage tail protein [Stutzerimonas kunmingensis]MBD3877434.1 phage tail protein [Stutzerimonas kunmingensis]